MNTNNNILEWSEDEIKEFMASVWLLCVLGFKYRINNLPELRKQFPQFTWEYIPFPTKKEQEQALYPTYGNRFKDAHMIWDLEEGDLFATLVSGSNFGKYFCNSGLSAEEDSGEGRIHFYSKGRTREPYGELVGTLMNLGILSDD